MQYTQQREVPEKMSWARAMIFAIGFFFISAMLLGQLPGYFFTMMTSASVVGLESGLLGLAVVCLAGFTIIQVIVLLFDPKPVLPPVIFVILGAGSAIVGFALASWAALSDFHYFPLANTNLWPVLGGQFLWFQPNSIDLVMIGLAVLTVGLAMVLYGVLAQREMHNPDRRDPGTTPLIRLLLIGGTLLLVVFLILYTYVNNVGLAHQFATSTDGAEVALRWINYFAGFPLGLALIMTGWAFLLRLHYLMRPVRKRTMSGLYMVGALGLAQTGAILLVSFVIIYPLLAWMNTWTFIGLNKYLTLCTKPDQIPVSCAFSQQSGYIIDTILTSNFFVLLMAAVWAWKSNRNLVVIASLVTFGVVAMATLLLHTNQEQIIVAFLLCGAMLVLAAIWTSVSRREFALIGENNLGCLGMWLVFGTCFCIYLAAFAFFSIPEWFPENEVNIPFVAGLLLGPPAEGGTAAVAKIDAIVALVVTGVLAAIQFYYLARNRYKV
jgi:hypothetical protein